MTAAQLKPLPKSSSEATTFVELRHEEYYAVSGGYPIDKSMKVEEEVD